MNQGLRKPLVAGSSPAAASFYIRGLETKRLASGAEAGAAVLHRAPLDGAAANGAGFASLMSNLEIGMGCASSPLVTCYLFQTLPDIQHEFKGHCIRRLGFQRGVFTDVFGNAFTLYQLFRIRFSFLVCVAEYS